MSNSDQSSLPAAPGTIATYPGVWFVRGVMIGLLMAGACNAGSYFVRSGGGNLLGQRADAREAIGFPWQVWEQGNSYGGYFVDYRAMSANVAIALLIGSVCGSVLFLLRTRLDDIVAEFEAEMEASRGTRDHSPQLQFSLRGLLFSTGIVALLSAVLRLALAQRPEALGAIYFLGPWVLVGAALLPRKLPWQHRVALIIPLTFGLIVVGVGIGATLHRDLEQVLMGIFVCWTPQAVLAAMVLTLALLAARRGPKPRPSAAG
ncbi:MAG: hypothetical protein KDB14_20140 [Planctomycetales bacterium]|nr:hypothetical protein [Planctomycetales bacterium]